ncbi:histidine kinase [Sorangium cellulosum]|uniref:histidine kinase n=1 Tax=Sorangium cellulosum TaxID=56 RepID=A0A2L0ENH9_SORCE|nr:ATP-binding protein [Sorangium cellulosum]AUX40846.1 histidine kinase [Sorangium cellulosum]
MGCAEPAAILLLRGRAAASDRFEALLRRHVPDVEVVCDPERALERCQREPPPVLAVDWSDPAGAAAFCSRLRSQPGGEAVLLLALTERDVDVEGILAAGAGDFLLVSGEGAAAAARLAVVRERAARDAASRQTLAQAQARLVLAGRMASVGTLAAGVAHEINNPLAFVITNVDAAMRRIGAIDRRSSALDRRGGAPWARSHGDGRGSSSELSEVLGLLEDAREGAERVRLIVRDLHTFSRAGDDHQGPVDVRRVLDSCVHMAMNEIRHRARVVRSFQEVPPVEANEPRLAQVFLNLIVNAAQAIPEGLAEQNEIELRTRCDAAGWVVVEVRDTGTGIAKEALGRIFDPFYTSKEEGEGLGLGLSISQSIVAALGGRIEVESRPGAGSTFRVVLPAASAGEGRAPAATEGAPRWLRESSKPPAAEPAAPRRRILVIDDEPLLARAIAGTLEPRHETIATASARDALARIRAGERYDAILCDLMMPDMTGMDFYASLGEHAPDQQRRIVFLTGGAFTERSKAFLDQVSARLLLKPFDAGTLLSLIDEVVASPVSDSRVT